LIETMENPLLEDRVHPAFTRITPEHAEPAIDTLIAEGRRLIAALTPGYRLRNLGQPRSADRGRG
jgi:Zn-dependent oligopeptidase